MSFSILKHIPEKPINENKLQEWLDANLNALLIGLHGTGKTMRILACFNKNFENRWAYFNGTTTDPWTDLIGIPTAELDKNGNKVIKYIKPEELSDDIQGIYIDELNRAKTAVRNALLELIQFKSINGRKFPNLKVVWASINPPQDDGENNEENFNYDVEELDAAMIDRFHVIVKVPAEPDLTYFKKHHNHVGVNLIEWWNQQPKEAKSIITPRRLEYIAMMHKMNLDITDALPKCCNIKMLLKKIDGSPTINKFVDLCEQKTTASVLKELYKLINTENSFEEIKGVIVKDNRWEMLDLISNEEKIDLLYKNYSTQIKNYFFKNFTDKGNLFEYLSKKLKDDEDFQKISGTASVAIHLDTSKYKASRNIQQKDDDILFLESIGKYLSDGDNMDTYNRRACFSEIMENFPKSLSPNAFGKFVNFANLLVSKTQLSNRADKNHQDGQYIEAVVNLAIEGCKIKNIPYKNESFYKDIVSVDEHYFDAIVVNNSK